MFIEHPVGTDIVKTNETTLRAKKIVDDVADAFFAKEVREGRDTTGQSNFHRIRHRASRGRHQ